MTQESPLITVIPGIGPTFLMDFSRIEMRHVDDYIGVDPDTVYAKLQETNTKLGHKTSKNYLYIIRMICYYAEGGREVERLKWNKWKD
jgi:hypothetical protein